MARKSIVLLKNEGGLLPLDKGGEDDRRDRPAGRRQGHAARQLARARRRPTPPCRCSRASRPPCRPATRVVHAEGVKLVTGPRDFMAPHRTFNTTDRSGIPAAVEAARAADVVVVAVGEDAFQSGEGRSQVDIGLKGLQEELLRAVLEVNKKVVVVLMNGRPLTLAGRRRTCPAIVEAWHLGSQAGHAIADVLFGDYNPSGKLPVGFPRHVGQLPMTYAHKNTGPARAPSQASRGPPTPTRPNDPLYPFGFGLSYTTFTYSAPRLSAPEIGRNGSLAGHDDRDEHRQADGHRGRAALRARPRGQRDAPGEGAEGLPAGRAPARAIARCQLHAEGLRPRFLHGGRAGGRPSPARSRCSSAATRAT